MTQHGVAWSYTSSNVKCRCDKCREAFRVYQTERNQKRFAYTKEYGLPEGVKHGVSAYKNWGCRCDVCTKANTVKCKPHTAAYRERQKAKKESAS